MPEQSIRRDLFERQRAKSNDTDTKLANATTALGHTQELLDGSQSVFSEMIQKIDTLVAHRKDDTVKSAELEHTAQTMKAEFEASVQALKSQGDSVEKGAEAAKAIAQQAYEFLSKIIETLVEMKKKEESLRDGLACLKEERTAIDSQLNSLRTMVGTLEKGPEDLMEAIKSTEREALSQAGEAAASAAVPAATLHTSTKKKEKDGLHHHREKKPVANPPPTAELPTTSRGLLTADASKQ